MKKRNMIAALLCSACLVAGSVNPVFADASKVVTLGADLTDAQKQTMMKYFNVSSDQVQVMTITNEDEHKHLDNIAPQSQIGSITAMEASADVKANRRKIFTVTRQYAYE